MAEDVPDPAPSITWEEMQAEAELGMRDIGQRFGALPKDKDELLKLLEDAETWLVRLDQKKICSMPDILSPTKGVLISRDLLDHPDPNVKLAVTSCLTEVTKLTAPDPPYSNDVMKEVFQRIVDTFADLGDTNSPSYERRVLILDSVASVRCCILMLDLDLDHLILDMFHHLFNDACTKHSENIIQWMETILSAVIEESDDIDSELASCVLQNLTKDAQAISPASFALAERLVVLSKDRLKPVFDQLLRGKPLDIYSNVVTFLCQDASNPVAGNNLDASGTSTEMVSETKTEKTKAQQEDSGVSIRKHLQEAEEATRSKKNKTLAGDLVGTRIKVWWPDDKMFYNGFVEAFYTSSKRHKVAYDDGDIETLQLKEERWEFTDEEQDSDSDAASDIPRGRRGKGSSSLQVEVGKIGTPQNGSDGGNPPKKKRHPKGVLPSSNADIPVSSAKLKGKGAEKDTKETPKPGRKITR